ncbi:glutaminase [Microbacterium hominis]|uniref:Glutaminase n=2 Tax=Microbacterium hominis TaxID=162426 RepID=A0A7D4QLN6_9MICO|nr:glutaminase [Microbacterium hominis]QKJ21056.1 glutaminase [Microbacterium hominis]
MLEGVRRRLAAGGAPREALGALVQPRRILGIARAPRIVPRGHAWHLGVLLLTDDAVLATGDVVRARPEVRRGYTAQSQRERAERAAAAHRGGFAEGTTVHIDWQPIDLDALGEASTPLAVRAGAPAVRWSRSGGWMPLPAYLDERADLLLHPPAGASA